MQLIEPPLNIVGPALEASKYYIEYGDIRSMFAKLIASAMNENNKDKAHTSFVEIIKQLSPLDAQNLKYLSQNPISPVGQIRMKSVDEESSNCWVDNFFPFTNYSLGERTIFSASIENLIRLGLIKINWNNSFTAPKLYDSLLDHPLYKECEDLFKLNPDHPTFLNNKISLLEGSWFTTDFGILFNRCCF
jgi:hypothetical protein